MKAEIQKYIQGVYDSQIEDAMKDVYITDHKAKPRKLNTTNAKDDEQFFNYYQSLEQYNSEARKAPRVSQHESGRFERGSLA